MTLRDSEQVEVTHFKHIKRRKEEKKRKRNARFWFYKEYIEVDEKKGATEKMVKNAYRNEREDEK